MNVYFSQWNLALPHYLRIRIPMPRACVCCEGATSGLGLSVACSSLSRLGWLTSEPQGLPGITFPALELKVPPYLGFLTCVQGPTQDFIIVRQTFIDWVISSAPPLKTSVAECVYLDRVMLKRWRREVWGGISEKIQFVFLALVTKSTSVFRLSSLLPRSLLWEEEACSIISL